MDPENDSEEKIRSKLRCNNLFRIGFAIWFSLVGALKAYVSPKLSHSYNVELVWVEMALIMLMYLVEMIVDIYLITMLFKLQIIFRKFGLVTGYKAEILIAVIYPFTLVTYTREQCMDSIIKLLINVSDYECSN